MKTKRCSVCEKDITLDGYSKNATKLFGVQSECKVCVKRLRQTRDLEPRRLADIRRRKTKNRIDQERGRGRNKKARVARDKIKIMVASGKIPPVRTLSCADCGKQARDYHHEDYDKPLDVLPLCRSCHQTRHSDSPIVMQPPGALSRQRIGTDAK